jgi:acyl-CoA thioester hydrolase
VTAHRHTIRVYYEDTDAGGVMYHAAYLRFAERARTEALREAGAPHAELVEQEGLFFVVRRIKMDYLRPARLDSLVVVETGTLAIGGASITLRQRFLEAETLLAEAEVLLVCVRAENMQPARIPERWRNVLAPDGAGRTEVSGGKGDQDRG